MCACPELESVLTLGSQKMSSSIDMNHVRNMPTLTAGHIIVDVISTLGPQVARQWMRYNNQTVADKVPPEMLHLVDPHW